MGVVNTVLGLLVESRTRVDGDLVYVGLLGMHG